MKPDKSAQKSVPGRPFEDGFDPRRGRGPRKGAANAGRPPDAFKNFLAQLRDSPEFHAELKRALTDCESRGFSAALKVLTMYDDEKPANRIRLDAARIRNMSDDELAAIAAGKPWR